MEAAADDDVIFLSTSMLESSGFLILGECKRVGMAQRHLKEFQLSLSCRHRGFEEMMRLSYNQYPSHDELACSLVPCCASDP